MEIDFSSLELEDGAIPATLRDLIFSDNTINKGVFCDLFRDGLSLDGFIEVRHGMPTFAVPNKNHNRHKNILLLLLPNVEAFLINYLLSGKNSGFPSYPASGVDTGYYVDSDYILKHIKREINRDEDEVTYNKEELNGVKGVRVIASYPYGSIDYGFLPYYKDELLTLLEDVEAFVYHFHKHDIPDLQNHNLQTETRELHEGEHLDSVFKDKLIPSNTIIDKTICGVGATWLEIHSKRNSIIIEPNVPVIIGKVQQHPNVIGVYGDTITYQDVAKKIQEQQKDSENGVKLMTTPDSYPKVAKALKWLKIDYKANYFLLFDECEKIVSDIDYRKNIVLPIDEFFDFTNKAMVSATPIVIDDPRFEQQGFKIIEVQPQFDYKKPLELMPTNNVELKLKRTLETTDPDQPVCMFYNSVKGIVDLIDYLKIGDDTNIYCSTEAMKPLKKDGYNVSDSVTDNDGKVRLKKYNFFTSRFYSAVDIKVDSKPTLIMITQVFKTLPKRTPYSLIDPETEAIQIVGRFRNGVSRIIHITNTNPKIEFKYREDLEQFLKEQHAGYHSLLKLKKEAQTDGEKYIIEQAIDSTDYKLDGYVTEKGDINYFRYNNAYLDERLKMLYRYPAPLHKSYNKSGAFTLYSESDYMAYTDEEKNLLQNRNTPKAERIRLLYELIDRLANSSNYFDKRFINELRKDYDLYFEARNVIGYRKVRELDFVDSKVRAEVKRIKEFNQKTDPKVIAEVYKIFKPNTTYSTSLVNDELKAIYNKFGIDIVDGRGVGNDIFLYFEGKQQRQRDGWKCLLGNKRY